VARERDTSRSRTPASLSASSRIRLAPTQFTPGIGIVDNASPLRELSVAIERTTFCPVAGYARSGPHGGNHEPGKQAFVRLPRPARPGCLCGSGCRCPPPGHSVKPPSVEPARGSRVDVYAEPGGQRQVDAGSIPPLVPRSSGHQTSCSIVAVAPAFADGKRLIVPWTGVWHGAGPVQIACPPPPQPLSMIPRDATRTGPAGATHPWSCMVGGSVM
jgi:hypothetical protein